jgi:lysophospholipase L1-like esterase
MRAETVTDRKTIAGPRRRSGRTLVTGLLLLAVAVGAGLLALEAAARVVFDRSGMHYGIEMWKYARLVKRESASPAVGHEHVPRSHARLMGVDVTINSQGLRSPEAAAPKEPGVRRLLVLGDSLTFGWGVDERETYPRVLERMLNAAGRRYEVINAGVGNYNTAQEVAWFTERGLAYAPDEVILGFYINDAEPTPRKTQGWLASRSYLYVVAASFWDAMQRKAGLKEGYVDYYGELYRDGTPGWLSCQAALEQLIAATQVRGIRLTVALLPELHDVEETYPFRFVHEQVAIVLARHGTPVVDLDRAFRGHEPSSLWVSPGDAHPNALAQRIIAERLFEAMTAANGRP